MTYAETQDRNDSLGQKRRIRELIALGLLGVEGLVILGYVVAAIAERATTGLPPASDFGAHSWGYTLTLASGWAAPAAVVVFLLGPLALVAWMNLEGGGVSEERSGLVLTLELVLAILTVIGGIVSIVGHVLQFSPSVDWSSFFLTLGNGLGSVVLGFLGLALIKWLADGGQLRWSSAHDGGERSSASQVAPN